MTTVYFIRHAQADNSIRDGRNRPLTEKGLRDRRLVTEFLRDKHIDAVLSSPFRRALETLAGFSEDVELVEDFRERESDSDWDRSTYEAFIERQWADFTYTLSDGECLKDVQDRNIKALEQVLEKYKGKTIAIGTHGTALSTIINYYDSTFKFEGFMAMLNLLPWAVKMTFEQQSCTGIEKINLIS